MREGLERGRVGVEDEGGTGEGLCQGGGMRERAGSRETYQAGKGSWGGGDAEEPCLSLFQEPSA